MMNIEEITRKLFALLDEMKLSIEQENYKKVRKLNEKYEFLLKNNLYDSNPLKLEIDDCRELLIMAATERNFHKSLIFFNEAKTKYTQIKPKLIEKCIWRMGLDTGAVKEKDIIKNHLDCLSYLCDGYNINCKKHPEYKRYKEIKDSLLNGWKPGFLKFSKIF